MPKNWETTMIKQLRKSLLIILFQLKVLIQEFFLFLLVLELERSVLKDLHHDTLGLLLQEYITDTQQPRQLLKLPINDPLY
jgi:hypothetical protein